MLIVVNVSWKVSLGYVDPSVTRLLNQNSERVNATVMAS